MLACIFGGCRERYYVLWRLSGTDRSRNFYEKDMWFSGSAYSVPPVLFEVLEEHISSCAAIVSREYPNCEKIALRRLISSNVLPLAISHANAVMDKARLQVCDI